MRYTYCQTLSPIAAVARFFQMYRDEAEKAGYQASPDQLAWSNTIYVAETDAKALQRGAAASRSAGELAAEDADRDAAAARLHQLGLDEAHARRQGHRQDAIDRGTDASGVVIIGSPATVREKLAEYQDLAGFNTSLTKTQFGTHAERHGPRQHDGNGRGSPAAFP